MRTSEYRRSTSAMAPSSLPEDLLAAIRQKAESSGMGDVVASASAAILTTSVRERRRLGRSKRTEQRCAVLFTPEWLVWATDDGSGAPVVASCHLSRLDLAEYGDTAMAELVSDNGLEVTMPVAGSAESALGSLFIGLGPESAASAFAARLGEATRAAGGVVRFG